MVFCVTVLNFVILKYKFMTLSEMINEEEIKCQVSDARGKWGL